jgi:hypothetical protein
MVVKLRHLTLRVHVFDNRMLRRIFGPKIEEVTGGWRELDKEENHHIYSAVDTAQMTVSRRMRWVGCVTYMREVRNAYRVFVRRPKGRRPLGRPMHR